MKLATRRLAVLMVVTMVITACGSSQLDNNLATFNALATQSAQGINVTLPDPGVLLTPVATPTTTITTYDLLNDPGGSVVHAWGQVNGLPSGTTFQIAANNQQVGEFLIATMRLNGWDQVIKGGSAVIGNGQIRVDLALQTTRSDGSAEFGSGTATFQPTLDELGRVKLNPLGADFGSLEIPNNFTGSIGDAIYSLLSGAPNNSLSKVDMIQIDLQNGVMRVTGKVR